MKTNRATRYTLGVTATSRAVHAVLLQPGTDNPSLVRTYTRQRSARPMMSQPTLASGGQPYMDESSGNDFTIQFGDGMGGGNELFLASEFSGAETLRAEDALNPEAGGQPASFAYELSEILQHIREDGFGEPVVAFCAGSSDLVHVELRVQAGAGEKKGAQKAARSKKPGRDMLPALLAETYKGDFDKERLAFIPMTPADDGSERYLAVFPKTGDSIAGTLSVIREQKDETMPSVRLLDAEISVYLGLARAWRAEREPGEGGQETEHTLIVRAGSDDTLVLFVEGDKLRHFESMRSLTVFDSPDTICSRVLLLQDEYGIDDVRDVLLLSEEREEDMIESFGLFFPDASVTSLRRTIRLDIAEGEGLSKQASAVAAAGVATRVVGDPFYEPFFEKIDLLSRRFKQRRLQFRVQWQVPALYTVLFLTAFFFAGRYVVMESKIDVFRDELRQYPPELADADVHVLQSRIDSLQSAYTGYMNALNLLDTLLIGSDRWSRGLEEINQHTSALKGVWIDSWTPTGSTVRITGNATSRDRVVHLADRTDGDIESMTFSEIRGHSVYSFTMLFPLEQDLPEAARYLREKAAATIQAARDEREALPDGPATNARPISLK